MARFKINNIAIKRIQILKELESKDVPYELVKDTVSKFNRLLKIKDLEDKKTLFQLIIRKITIKSKNDIESIELHFDEKGQKYFINNKEGESSDNGGSPSFILFTIRI